jgi:NTE family protein
MYGRVKSDRSAKNQDNEAFEYVIRYEDGIESDFVLASCSMPMSSDYTRLNVETRALAVQRQGDDAAIEDIKRC